MNTIEFLHSPWFSLLVNFFFWISATIGAACIVNKYDVSLDNDASDGEALFGLLLFWGIFHLIIKGILWLIY